MDDQSSSSSKKKMSKTSSSSSSSSFFAKMFSCFHPKASASTDHHHEQQQQQTNAHHHHMQQQQQQQQEEVEKLVIYVGGVGLDKESMMRCSVPWKYVSNPQFEKLILEKSGEEKLEKIRSEGSVVIHCQVKEFEGVYKSVKAEEKEKICKEKSYDDRLWSRSWNTDSKR